MAASSQKNFCYLSMKSTSYFSSVVSHLCPAVNFELNRILKWQTFAAFRLSLSQPVWVYSGTPCAQANSAVIAHRLRCELSLRSAVMMMFQRAWGHPTPACSRSRSLIIASWGKSDPIGVDTSCKGPKSSQMHVFFRKEEGTVCLCHFPFVNVKDKWKGNYKNFLP